MYIGITTRKLMTRWREHQCRARKGNQFYLYRAMRKYRIENFTIHQLEIADNLEQLKCLEENWISNLKSYGLKVYNLTSGGNGTFGYKHSKETKSKMSAAKRGRKLSAEHKLAISNSGKKRQPWKLSQETRDRISKAQLGKKRGKYKTKDTNINE